MKHSVKFELKTLKIIRWGSRSPLNAEFGHFTLLFVVFSEDGIDRLLESLSVRGTKFASLKTT